MVYANPWLSLREDSIEYPDGSRGIYSVLDKSDYAIVIAEQDGGFHLVEQFRYAIGQRSLEFPMGGWPAGKGGTAVQLAQAELSEETGFTAATWRHLGRLVQSTGYSGQRFDVFHATDLTPGEPHREATESDMEHRWVSADDFRRLIRNGTIIDSPTVAAYALLTLHS